MKRRMLVICFVLLIEGCAGAGMTFLRGQDVKGLDLNEVVEKVKNRGLICSEEYRSLKDLYGQPLPYGEVRCGTSGWGLICRDSYSVIINFDLKTRKVSSMGKYQSEHCGF